MSVYTQLTEQDFHHICDSYQLGNLLSYKGVADGIENTTYFFSTEMAGQTKEWVFTLFEYTDENALPYYLELYDHLYQKGVPVPDPQLNQHNSRLITLHNKPGTVFPRLPGRPPEQLTTELCFQCGKALAKFHVAGESYPEQHQCPKGLAFWKYSLTHFLELSKEDKGLIAQTIERYLSVIEGLPKTSVHGDLFHDNVLVENNQLTAIIDLFNASYDYAVLDLAITLNDWAIDKNSLLVIDDFHQALLEGYQSVRPLTSHEHSALPIMQQAAALRFWLSRIDTAKAFEDHKDSQSVATKDPQQMKELLISLIP